MTRRLAAATAAMFAVVALLGALGNSLVLAFLGVIFSVLCFVIAMLLKDAGID